MDVIGGNVLKRQGRKFKSRKKKEFQGRILDLVNGDNVEYLSWRYFGKVPKKIFKIK